MRPKPSLLAESGWVPLPDAPLALARRGAVGGRDLAGGTAAAEVPSLLSEF